MRRETDKLLQSISKTGRLTEDVMDTLSPDSWSAVWRELLGRDLDVPSPPTLSEHLARVLEKYKLLLVYIPLRLTEAEYPTIFVKPDWGRMGERCTSVERIPLRGGWALVETIPKPDWLTPEHKRGRYLNDTIIEEWGIETRFELSWRIACSLVSDGVSRKLELPAGSALLTSLEEWNAVANLFNWLREHRAIDLPDLGSTIASEWCRNAVVTKYGTLEGVVTGWRTSGGIADVGHYADAMKSIGYRYIVWL